MEKTNLPYGRHSILFAPMEGVTDPIYRKTVMGLFPEWSMFATDFLRVPTEGTITHKKALEHFGEEIYENLELREKTTFQILTTPRANTEQTVQIIDELGFNHLDLNLGCPSRRVNAHLGGSYLLSDLKLLEQVVGGIRKKFNRCFTVKIRVGYKDDSEFDNIIKVLSNCGVEAITIHGRTKVEMYKGVAQWKYFSRACELTNVPIIANGDIWTPEDIQKIFTETDCYGVMCGRSAMKTPWLAQLYYLFKERKILTSDQRLSLRTDLNSIYFSSLEKNLFPILGAEKTLKKMKSLIRYSFDDYNGGELFKRKLLRTPELATFLQSLSQLKRDSFQ